MISLRTVTDWRPPASFPGRKLLAVLTVVAVALSVGVVIGRGHDE